MTARMIDIEGVDGAGKGTQARRLHQRLTAEGYRSRLLGFPRYDATLFGQMAGEFLNGRYGGLDDVPPLFAALLFAGDRLESRDWLLSLMDEADVVVCDRYVASNIAHQGAKLDGADRTQLVERIERIEHDIHRLPRPDRTLLLDLPVPVARELVGRKGARDYTDKPADLQESNEPYLERVRAVYRELAATRCGWSVVECVGASGIRSVEEIGDEIRAAIADLVPLRTAE
jgi:dTMP kinase